MCCEISLQTKIRMNRIFCSRSTCIRVWNLARAVKCWLLTYVTSLRHSLRRTYIIKPRKWCWTSGQHPALLKCLWLQWFGHLIGQSDAKLAGQMFYPLTCSKRRYATENLNGSRWWRFETPRYTDALAPALLGENDLGEMTCTDFYANRCPCSVVILNVHEAD